MTRCDGCHYYKPVYGKMMCTWLPHGYSDDSLCKCELGKSEKSTEAKDERQVQVPRRDAGEA